MAESVPRLQSRVRVRTQPHTYASPRTYQGRNGSSIAATRKTALVTVPLKGKQKKKKASEAQKAPLNRRKKRLTRKRQGKMLRYRSMYPRKSRSLHADRGRKKRLRSKRVRRFIKPRPTVVPIPKHPGGSVVQPLNQVLPPAVLIDVPSPEVNPTELVGVSPPTAAPVLDQGLPDPLVLSNPVDADAPFVSPILSTPGEFVPPPPMVRPAEAPLATDVQPNQLELNIVADENIIPDPAFIHVLEARTEPIELGNEWRRVESDEAVGPVLSLDTISSLSREVTPPVAVNPTVNPGGIGNAEN